MIKPLGVLVVLGFALALIFCLIPVLWGIVRGIRNRAWKTVAALIILAIGIGVFDVWAVHAVAPKGGRTIARLEIADGHAFVIRHYRFGWFEFPKACFYARDKQGVWTSFALISESVDPGASSLVFDESKQEVEAYGVGGYLIRDNDFVNADGSGCLARTLPPGIEPEQDDVYGGAPHAPR